MDRVIEAARPEAQLEALRAELPVPAHRDRDFALRRLLVAGDAGAVVLALWLGLLLSGRPQVGHRLLWGLVAIPVFVVLFKLYGLYEGDSKRISHSTVDDLPRIFHVGVIGGLLVWLYAKHTPLNRLDFSEIALFGVLFLGLATVIRVAVRSGSLRFLGPERALIVGSGRTVDALIAKLAAHPEYRTEVVGVLTTQSAGAVMGGVPVLGSEYDLERIGTEQRVARVIFSAPQMDESELEELLRRCRRLSLKVSVLPRLSDVLGPAVEVDDVEGITVLGVNPPWLPRSSRAIKRAMDVAVASALLLLFAPIVIVVAALIKLDSRGPVFFSQERVGKSGRRFRLFKFRTMVLNAEERRRQLLEHSTDPHWLKLEYDPRITRVGRRLRRLSLDELPQLWNVVRGDMSMVGPRPLIPVEDELVRGWARGRLDLTPGITGYWQVLGRTRIPFEEMVKLDYLYVMNWSLWEDVRLMLRTLPVILGGHGAN
jgi:exopolysaccharide biosynthesis polyprenyl glycosylphosphotransferase